VPSKKTTRKVIVKLITVVQWLRQYRSSRGKINLHMDMQCSARLKVQSLVMCVLREEIL